MFVKLTPAGGDAPHYMDFAKGVRLVPYKDGTSIMVPNQPPFRVKETPEEIVKAADGGGAKSK